MMSLETPLHKVRGLGSAHSGVGSFAYQRVTALILIPLTIWFAITAVGLIGVREVSALIFLSNPMHAILMAVFALAALSHLALGLREVITDYVQHGGIKLILLLAVYCFSAGTGLVCCFSLLRISL